MTECNIEDKGGYYQVSGFDFEAENFQDIFPKLETALKTKKQDLLLSLVSVGVLYSSHLAIFVRIHQMMHRNNLHFVISDVSPEIRNLLQITQLDSIFSIYETIDDFKSNLKFASNKQQTKSDFEWQIVKGNDDIANVICKGNMFAGDQLDELQKSIEDHPKINFDFHDLSSMDSASIAFLNGISEEYSVTVTGANETLIEQFSPKLVSLCRA
jgi:anti-anti-sigma factor